MTFSPAHFNFTDRVAMVTGGATGIGRATSLLFARHGARVVIGDINPEGAETAGSINQEGGEALFVKTDVSEAEQVQNLLATTVKTYGALHHAFNNAGILPIAAPLADLEEARFDEIIAVDLKGVFSLHEIRDFAHAEIWSWRDREQRFDCRHDCGSRRRSLRGGKTCGDRVIQSGGT
jgi:NADP-dependent 3-hydroxy acid dehydrogenase YdfG